MSAFKYQTKEEYLLEFNLLCATYSNNNRFGESLNNAGNANCCEIRNWFTFQAANTELEILVERIWPVILQLTVTEYSLFILLILQIFEWTFLRMYGLYVALEVFYT